MKILVIRHGQPDIDRHGILNAHEFGRWLQEYNASLIDHDLPPSEQLLGLVDNDAYVVCSSLPRSIDSTRLLNISNIHITSSLFNEFDMPYASWKRLRLSKLSWAVIFRILWIFGYSSHAESFKKARERALKCAQELETYAAEHKSIIYIGHGTINRFIIKTLLKRGWKGEKNKRNSYYWEYTILSYEPDRATK